VKWFDEERYPFYHADGDLCLKIWEKGYRIVPCPSARVDHFVAPGEGMRKQNIQAARANEDWQKYLSRWEGIFHDRGEKNTGGWIRTEDLADDSYASAFERLHSKGISKLLKSSMGRIKSKLG